MGPVLICYWQEAESAHNIWQKLALRRRGMRLMNELGAVWRRWARRMGVSTRITWFPLSVQGKLVLVLLYAAPVASATHSGLCTKQNRCVGLTCVRGPEASLQSCVTFITCLQHRYRHHLSLSNFFHTRGGSDVDTNLFACASELSTSRSFTVDLI